MVPYLWAGHCETNPASVPPGKTTPPHPTPHSGEGCGSLLTKGEFPLWMGDKRQPQGVPLLNRKASDLLSFLGGQEVPSQTLSHPREDELSSYDPSQRSEPAQIGGSHLRVNPGWAGSTKDKGCGSAPVHSAHLRLYLPHLQVREGDGRRGKTCFVGCLPSLRFQSMA